jgi:hypothetical protein
LPQCTVAAIAIVAMVERWIIMMVNATPLESRTPNRQIAEKRIIMMVVSTAAAKGKVISPAR